MGQTKVADSRPEARFYTEPEPSAAIAADPVIAYMSKAELSKQADKTQKLMEKASKDLNFIEAARYRDEWFALKKLIEEKV